ncbi:MAG TPA: Ig-like domain-containing protein [Polyangiaceae bacterium]|nr:Ig-like domain-containing protein [Polyangiaceae bacterium]
MKSKRWLVGLRIVFLCGVVGAACAPGERPPTAPVNGTLGLQGERAAKKDDSKFRVVFAAPQGTASSAAELSVVWSRPLRALEIAGNAPPPPITITPPLPGKFLWVGTRAVRFVPETPRLPGASHFTVEIPGSMQALDGTRLGEPYRFEFETPRPKIVDSTPSDGQTGLELDRTLTLEMNQPVDPARLERVSKLTATTNGVTKGLAFTASRPDPKTPKKILVKPKAPLPKNSTISLQIAASLVGEEGPLPMGADASVSFETYGPLVVAQLDCDKNSPHGQCAAGSSIGLSLSNPVRAKDLEKALSITPPVPLRPSTEGEDGFTTYVSLGGPFAAGKSYTLTVAQGLTDKYGQALAAPNVQPFTMDDYFPRAEIGVTGDTLASARAKPIQVGSINLPTYELLTASIRPEDLSELFRYRTGEEQRNFVAKLPRARVRSVASRAAKNTVSRESVVPRDVLGGEHGVLALGIDYTPDSRDYHSFEPFRLLEVTDLAVSAKVSRFGSLVWVTKLATGEPVQGATVTLVLPGSAKQLTYRTDQSGLATVPQSDFSPNLYESGPDLDAYFVVRSEDDWTFERVISHLPEWELSVPVDLSGNQRAYGMIFTERGVYRPGDSVRFKGILRQETPTGNATIAGADEEVVLKSPDGETVSSLAVKTSRFGTFSGSFTVPLTAALGSFRIEVETGNGGASESFDVAEYRPAEFKTTTETDRPSYVRGDRATFLVHGDYLFGAPMAGASVRATVARGSTYYAVPDSDGFSTDASAYYADLDASALSSADLATENTKLDPKGLFSLSKKLDLPGQRGPEVVRLDAEVTDVSRQSIAGSTSAIVHPAEFYVGLETGDDSFVSVPADVRVGAVAFSPEGRRLQGKPVHVELVQRRWTIARETLPGGGEHVVSKVVDKVAGSCDVTTAAEAARCAVHLTEGGYYVAVARAKDSRGNVAVSAYGLYAMGEGRAAFGDNDRGQVDLVPNKKQYQVGDVAKVLVKSPFAEAEALVTVERAGVYHSERVTLRGPMPTVSVPVTEELRPNAFVSVHLLRAGKSKAKGAPYRIGYAPLVIDAESRRLRVAVTPRKKEARPGEEITVDLAVQAQGKAPGPTELAVYAVDEGVLMLSGYHTPDPVPVFTAPRPLQVATLETRSSLAKISLDDFMSSLGSEKGAEGGGGGEGAARRDFRTTAFFEPSVLTDASGRATVKFKLPESLTTFRVMAVATSESDRHGFGQANVVTSRRLMARPNLPRFLRAGDRMQAGIVVSSKGLQAGKVEIHATATGLVLEGPSDRTIELPKDGSVEVRFPFRAETVTDAKLRFDVRAGGEKDAVEVVRRVVAPGTPETVALYGSTEESVAEKLGDYSTIRTDTGRLDVSLASSALVGLDGAAAQLVEYPYACTEQLSSRVLPLIPLKELATAFGFAMPKDADGVAGRAIAEIVARQHYDGGFRMWPESPEATPWVSAYATWVLDMAAAHGAKVPKNARDRAHDYIRRYLQSIDGDRFRLATAAFMLDVLADAGIPDPGYMSRVFEQRKLLPVFARGLLLHALVVGKGAPSAVTDLTRELSSELRIANDAAFVAENVGDEYAVLLDSEARTGAMVLRGLLAADPKLALGPQLARGLLSQRREGAWRSTQESAFALLALDAYRKAQEKGKTDFTAKVWLGDDPIHTARFEHGLTVDHSFFDLGKLKFEGSPSLSFEKKGSGKLFYETRLEYVRKTLPATSLDQGFYVQKAMRAVTPETLAKELGQIEDVGTTKLPAGGLVLTDLVVVTSGPRDYVVVDDPIPAGLEAVDTSLATSASWLAESGSTNTADTACDEGDCDSYRDALSADRAFLSSWYRREVRDDRVLFFVDHMAAGMYHYRYLARATTYGTFVVPPTKAEEMYTPETFGRTAAETVVVK